MNMQRIAIIFIVSVAIVFSAGLLFSSMNVNSDLNSLGVVITPKAVSDNPCDYLQPTDRELSAEEAVAAAECFIIQNGYTDLPPIADRSKLTPENVFPGTDEEGMKMRHDSLERTAYSYVRDSELYGGSWVVMFRYRPHPDLERFQGERFGKVGRAVIVDFYGKDIFVRHTDFPLLSPDAKVLNR